MLAKGGTTMFWADRINKVAGVVLLLLVALTIADIVLDGAAVGDANTLARGEIEDALRDINDDEALYVVGNAFSVATDAVLVLASAAVLYLLFRDRSRVLALFGAFGLLGAGAAFMASDAGDLTLAVLAADFVEEGGPGGVAAGDPAILQSARSVAAFANLFALMGVTALGFAFVAVGTLLAWAPQGEVNPPRWLGGLAILSGVALVLSWIMTTDWDIGGAVSFVGIVGALLTLLVLGGWLLLQPERGEARAAAAQSYQG